MYTGQRGPNSRDNLVRTGMFAYQTRYSSKCRSSLLTYADEAIGKVLGPEVSLSLPPIFTPDAAEAAWMQA